VSIELFKDQTKVIVHAYIRFIICTILNIFILNFVMNLYCIY